jgi:hypothetical protein
MSLSIKHLHELKTELQQNRMVLPTWHAGRKALLPRFRRRAIEQNESEKGAGDRSES